MSTVTTEVKPKVETRALIWDALESLRASAQVASRQRVAKVTGLKLTTVDDHLNRMVEDGLLRRPVNGVVEIIDPMPEPRSVSVTLVPGGLSKVEVGDVCFDLWPQERRLLGSLLQGDAFQLSNILMGEQMNTLVSQVWGELRQLKRDLGG